MKEARYMSLGFEQVSFTLLVQNFEGANDVAYSNSNSNMIITNTIGQVMMQQKIYGRQTKADVSMLPPGIYFITLSGDTGVKVVRVEKI